MDEPMPFPDNMEELTEAEAAELEFALYQSLHAVDAPAGFAERVLAKAAAAGNAGPVAVAQPTKPAPGGRLLTFPSRFRAVRSLPAMGAIAAGLLIAAFTGYDLHTRHQEQVHEAAAATQQFDLATEITDRALQRAQEHAEQQIERAHIPAGALR